MNDTRAEYLCGRLDFWDSLSERQQSRLLDGTTISRYKKGSVIHNGVGDLGLIFVRRGRVCVYTVSEEGREFVLLRFLRETAARRPRCPWRTPAFRYL